jgi:hypothetical protein
MFGVDELEAAYLDYGKWICLLNVSILFLVAEVWREFVDITLKYKYVAAKVNNGNEV